MDQHIPLPEFQHNRRVAKMSKRFEESQRTVFEAEPQGYEYQQPAQEKQGYYETHQNYDYQYGYYNQEAQSQGQAWCAENGNWEYQQQDYSNYYGQEEEQTNTSTESDAVYEITKTWVEKAKAQQGIFPAVEANSSLKKKPPPPRVGRGRKIDRLVGFKPPPPKHMPGREIARHHSQNEPNTFAKAMKRNVSEGVLETHYEDSLSTYHGNGNDDTILEDIEESKSPKASQLAAAANSIRGLQALAARASERRRSPTQEVDPLNSSSSQLGNNMTRAWLGTTQGANLGQGYAMFCDPWTKGKLIGQGQFGVVYIARNESTKATMAVKQVILQSLEMLDQMIGEVVLMCRASFRNENVVGCMGWSISDPSSEETTNFSIAGFQSSELYIQTMNEEHKRNALGKNFNIFMEYMELGSLASVLERQKHGFDQAVVKDYLRQLLLGLRSLHAAGIAHRDIKCQNLLLTANGKVKLADFGCAKRVAHVSIGHKNSIQGSIPWMAPEVIRQEVGNSENGDDNIKGWKRADVWAVGCTMIEMLEGKPPWNNHSNPAAAMYSIATCRKPPCISQHSGVELEQDGHDFIAQCCSLSPAQRPSVAMLIYHPFIKGPSQEQQTQNRDSFYDDSEAY